MSHDLIDKLEQRFGRLHLRQRLGIEDEHEARASRRGGSLRPRRWYLSPALVRSSLQLTGLYWRARRNAERIEIRRHPVVFPGLPAAFDGFTILQLSDLHVDISLAAMRRLGELLPQLSYDLCVLTGDYRGKTYGPCEASDRGHGSAARADRRTRLRGPRQPRFDPDGAGARRNGHPDAGQRGRAAVPRRPTPVSRRHRRRPLLPHG